MSNTPKTPADKTAAKTPSSAAEAIGAPRPDASGEPVKGERIAKVLARAGVASRREVERMIDAGRVSVNGKIIDSPALNVGPGARLMVDNAPVGPAEKARLWLYHKPSGLVTTDRDEKGRTTVFDDLPEDMPRVMSVGRLDLTSEGLLLLTNDGDIKRRLELPSTGWLRRYRVRIKGSLSESKLDELRAGITVDGVKYLGMDVQFDRQQGANAWLTVGIREGKNREIRRTMEAMGVVVNRLIRISYGPFRLNNLKASEVEEVKGRILRDQLGIEADDDTGFAKKAGKKPAFKGKGKPAFKPRGDTDDTSGKPKRTVTRSAQRDFDRSGRVAPGKRAGSATRVGRMENPNGPKGPSKGPGRGPAKGPQGGDKPKGRR